MRIDLTTKDIERFWSKVDRSGGPDACWVWQGAPYSGGYGRFSVGRKNFLAHRLSYAIAFGEVPEDLCVCHNCPDGDNRLCVNPRHFFLGTVEENNRDTMKKGRQARGKTHGRYTRPERTPVGINHWKAKLTPEAVVAIRKEREGGELLSKLATKYGCTKATIFRIVRRSAWKHIP